MISLDTRPNFKVSGLEMRPPFISVRKNGGKKNEGTYLSLKSFIVRIIKKIMSEGTSRVTPMPQTQSNGAYYSCMYFLLQSSVSSVTADENSTQQNIQTSIFTKFTKVDFR